MPKSRIFKVENISFKAIREKNSLKHLQIYKWLLWIRPGAKYIEKYSNTLQLLSLINDFNSIAVLIKKKYIFYFCNKNHLLFMFYTLCHLSQTYE